MRGTIHARVLGMADRLDSKSSGGFPRGGSSPPSRTMIYSVRVLRVARGHGACESPVLFRTVGSDLQRIRPASIFTTYRRKEIMAKIFLTLTFLGWWFLMSGWHPKQIGPFESQEICDKVRNNYLTAGNICWFVKPNC